MTARLLLASRAVSIRMVAGDTVVGETVLGFHRGASIGNFGTVSPYADMGAFGGVPYMGGSICAMYTRAGWFWVDWKRTGGSHLTISTSLISKISLTGIHYHTAESSPSFYNDGTYSGITWAWPTLPPLITGSSYIVDIS